MIMSRIKSIHKDISIDKPSSSQVKAKIFWQFNSEKNIVCSHPREFFKNGLLRVQNFEVGRDVHFIFWAFNENGFYEKR